MRPYGQIAVHAAPFGDSCLSVLGNIPDPPDTLYSRGVLPSSDHPRIAIVGARAMTPYGQRIARQLATMIATRGGVVISGLAFGVDVTVHRAALACDGKTIAVLPAGCDDASITPRSNNNTAQEIIKKGMVLSEYPSGTAYRKDLYVRRNRLISGLAHVVVVIEAALPSGSLTTAQHAVEQGKDVWAVPGHIDEIYAKGANALISDGAQPLIDLHVFVDQYCGRQVESTTSQSHPIIKLLADHPMTFEELLTALRSESGAVLRELSRLEVAGSIIRGNDQRYSLSG